MPVSADALRQHIDYTEWASRRILEAAAQLTPEERTRDFKTSDKNVLETLVHVFGADRLWLKRLEGTSPSGFVTPEERDFTVLAKEWPFVLESWKRWAASLSDETALNKCAYRDMKRNPYESPIWQIVLHVVNHGTHHRGMVSGFIRSMVHTPPPLDLIAYYRSL